MTITSRLRRALGGLRAPPQERSFQTRFPQYEIGVESYGHPDVSDWNEGTTLRVGAYCSIADRTKILLGGEHRPDWITTFPFNLLWPEARELSGNPRTKGNVVIGNDVWIASGVMILSGVTIGDGAVIGARALVTRDVPAYSFVTGVPAKVRGFRFDPDTISKLLDIAWWNWPRDKIVSELPLLCSGDVKGFIGRHHPLTSAIGEASPSPD